MMIWIAFACLIAAVLAAIVWPLAGKWQVPVDRAAYDRAVYRDQLAELDRDAARGLIGLAEAEAARNEIARRLLAAKDAEPAGAAGARRFAPLAATERNRPIAFDCLHVISRHCVTVSVLHKLTQIDPRRAFVS